MPIAARSHTIGLELRRLRERRSLSQLELATRAHISARHLSFLETGRSRPSPEMIVRLAEVMQVPMAEQNRLLLAGGFAPRYPQRSTDDVALASIMAGLRDLLDAHAPYPALLLDDHWDLVDANESIEPLIRGCDARLLEPPLNVLRLSLHPQGLAPRIHNLAAWRRHLMHQLEQRIAHSGGDPGLIALRDEVNDYSDGGGPVPPSADPVVLLEVEAGGHDLRLFSLATRIENASDITLDGLHLETFVPADERTRQLMAPR